MSKNRVYIPNSGCHDYSKAKKYGELIVLTSGRLNLVSIGRLYREMLPILQTSTMKDHILISGPTVANVVATTIFYSLHKKVNLLIYQRGKDGGDYYHRRCINCNCNFTKELS